MAEDIRILRAIPQANRDATVAPTVTDDTSKGYVVDSSWIDVTADKAYICLDPTIGAAVWAETTLDAAEVFFVSGTPGAGVGEVGDIAIDTDTGDIYEKKNVVTTTTWNPSDIGSHITLSGGDLIATHSASTYLSGVRSIFGATSGKWYWEVLVTKVGSYVRGAVGAACSSEQLNGFQLGTTACAYGYHAASGNKRNAGVETAYGVAWGGTYRLGIALDMDAGKIWFSRNGVWQNSGDPGAGTNEAFSGVSGTTYAMISLHDINNHATANFGETAFVYTVPDGFTAGLGLTSILWVKQLAVPKSNLSASIWLGAEGAYLPITNPAALVEVLGATVYGGWSYLAFDDTTSEHAVWRVPLPDYDGGDIIATTFSKPATTPVGAVTLQFDILTIGLANSEAFDSAATVDTTINISQAMDTTELNTDICKASATIDPANVEAGDLMVFELARDVVSDNLVGDGRIVGVLLEYMRS